jgi:hypothetical protein
MRNEYDANLTLAQLVALEDKSAREASYKRAMKSAHRTGVDPYNTSADYARTAERQFKDRCRRLRHA